MTLDNRLREIVGNNIDEYGEMSDDIVAQIKQAFADEGWVQTSKAVVNGKEVMYVDRKLMSGKAWYDRFINELKVTYKSKQGQPMNVPDLEDEVIAAARKAAGYERS